MLVPRFRGQRDNFILWSAQFKAVLNAKQVCPVLHGYDRSRPGSCGGEMVRTEAGDTNITDEELAGDVACLLNLEGLRKVLFSCVMAH